MAAESKGEGGGVGVAVLKGGQPIYIDTTYPGGEGVFFVLGFGSLNTNGMKMKWFEEVVLLGMVWLGGERRRRRRNGGEEMRWG